ncbi:hypothetical protein [Afifella sp. IM 167]|uniref:hypothetical protein n=1 Tax=Afifella sp. IM 167 TaxID=2033586 RepID=UPI001CCB4B35|nr:hypothetical protein [Afifella sp. IM 167]MBZ8131787.1 hypothetical protein [Afifella sp. IM 167]
MQHADGSFVLQKGEENAHQFVTCERMLGETLKPFMAEIYLVNCGIMASYIFSKSDANLRDILESSMESLRHPELLRYGRRAAVEIDPQSRMAITLGMEFVHDSLTAKFELVFNSDFVGVDISGISYRDAPAEPQESYELFVRAVADLSRTDA